MVGAEHVHAVEVIEDVDETASVPVVCHSAAIVDVTSRVDQHLRMREQRITTPSRNINQEMYLPDVNKM